jgi:hypothetical protein
MFSTVRVEKCMKERQDEGDKTGEKGKKDDEKIYRY